MLILGVGCGIASEYPLIYFVGFCRYEIFCKGLLLQTA